MNSSPARFPLIVRVAAVVCTFSVVAMLLAYVVHFGKPDFSSDDAVLSLLAESMWEQGALFPHGWIYNNGDLLTPSGTWLIAPLLAWFPNTYELHAVAGVFSIVVLLFASAKFLVSAKVPWPLIFMATAVLASGLSRISAIMLFLQTTYVWWPVGFLLGAYCVLRHRNVEHLGLPRTSWYWIGLALLVFLLGFSNPGRALMMFVFPLYVFDRSLVRMRQPEGLHPKATVLEICGARDVLVVFGISAPFVIASILYFSLLSSGIVQNGDNASRLYWNGMGGVVAHAKIFVSGWFDYLGGVKEFNAPEGPLEFVLRPARYLFAMFLTWVGIAEIGRLHRNQDPIRGALALALVAAFLPVLALYLAFEPLAQNYGTTRYFTLPICILVVLAALRISQASGWRRSISMWAIIPFCTLLLINTAIRFLPFLSQPSAHLPSVGTSGQMRLAKLLVDEGLEWGYGTWWNAGATSVLSGMKTRVNPIVLDSGHVSAFPVMRQGDWFSPNSWMGQTYLVLSKGEASTRNLKVLEVVLGSPVRTINSSEFVVSVYDKNIASAIVCDRGPPMDTPLDRENSPAHIVAATRLHLDNAQSPLDQAKVVVRNDRDFQISGHGRFPVAIGIRLIDRGSNSLNGDWVHWPLPCAVEPGQLSSIVVDLPKLPAGDWIAEVNLLQEGVAWFDQFGAAPVVMAISEAPGPSIWKGDFDQTPGHRSAAPPGQDRLRSHPQASTRDPT